MKMILAVVFAFALPVWAAKPAPKETKGSPKSHAFDQQVVEGQVYRPDYSVVTGEAPGEGWGVMRLRADFDDHSATDRQEKRR